MKHRILFLVAFLSVGLVTFATVDAATLTLQIAAMEGAQDSTVLVPIYATGVSNVGALQFDLLYDPQVLRVDTVTNGTPEGNGMVDSNSAMPGRLRIGMVTTEGIKSDGAVANVNFRIIGEPGTSSTLNIQDALAWDTPAHLEVLVNTEAGRVTVTAASPPWLTLGALVALLALGLFILLFALSRRRKPAPAYVPASTPPTQTARPTGLPERNTQGTWVCPHCKTVNTMANRFCGNCGVARA